MFHILCYGDSNTWGYTPCTGVRYDAATRWTGVMAKALGPTCVLHEDGINGRLSVFDSPFKSFLNGLDTLPAALWSQKPLDLLVLMLGTNDLKQHTAAQSAQGVGRLVGLAQAMDTLYPSGTPVFPRGPRILVISPIAIGTPPPGDDLAGKREESLRFPAAFAAMCAQRGVSMLDAQQVCEPSGGRSGDGVHMTPESHRALGLAAAERVRALLGDQVG